MCYNTSVYLCSEEIMRLGTGKIEAIYRGDPDRTQLGSGSDTTGMRIRHYWNEYDGPDTSVSYLLEQIY